MAELKRTPMITSKREVVLMQPLVTHALHPVVAIGIAVNKQGMAGIYAEFGDTAIIFPTGDSALAEIERFIASRGPKVWSKADEMAFDLARKLIREADNHLKMAVNSVMPTETKQ